MYYSIKCGLWLHLLYCGLSPAINGGLSVCVYSAYTVIWLYFALKIFGTLLFRIVLISYASLIVYEARVKISLMKNIRTFNFRTDNSVRN